MKTPINPKEVARAAIRRGDLAPAGINLSAIKLPHEAGIEKIEAPKPPDRRSLHKRAPFNRRYIILPREAVALGYKLPCA